MSRRLTIDEQGTEEQQQRRELRAKRALRPYLDEWNAFEARMDEARARIEAGATRRRRPKLP